MLLTLQWAVLIERWEWLKVQWRLRMWSNKLTLLFFDRIRFLGHISDLSPSVPLLRNEKMASWICHPRFWNVSQMLSIQKVLRFWSKRFICSACRRTLLAPVLLHKLERQRAHKSNEGKKILILAKSLPAF